MKKQSGFASVELVVLVVIVAAIAGVGYYVVKNHNNQPAQSNANFISSVSTPNNSVATLPMPQINSTTDLSNALNVLDQTNVGANSTDSSQLTTQSTGF